MEESANHLVYIVLIKNPLNIVHDKESFDQTSFWLHPIVCLTKLSFAAGPSLEFVSLVLLQYNNGQKRFQKWQVLEMVCDIRKGTYQG